MMAPLIKRVWPKTCSNLPDIKYPTTKQNIANNAPNPRMLFIIRPHHFVCSARKFSVRLRRQHTTWKHNYSHKEKSNTTVKVRLTSWRWRDSRLLLKAVRSARRSFRRAPAHYSSPSTDCVCPQLLTSRRLAVALCRCVPTRIQFVV